MEARDRHLILLFLTNELKQTITFIPSPLKWEIFENKSFFIINYYFSDGLVKTENHVRLCSYTLAPVVSVNGRKFIESAIEAPVFSWKDYYLYNN